MTKFLLPLAAVALAIGVTTAMDYNGLFNYSALILCPLLILFWLLQRLPRRDVGFTAAAPQHFFFALLYPLIVQGAIAAIAFAMNAVDLSHAVLWKVAANLGILFAATFLIAIVTEEGFFRGWLWGSLRRAGLGPNQVLLWTSIAFAAWHWSAITLDSGFAVPMRDVPMALANCAIIGAIWGVLRDRSGSVVVSSFSHGVWNAFTYVLFGVGSHPGALGISNTALYGPEVGLLGIALNALYLALILLFWKRRTPTGP